MHVTQRGNDRMDVFRGSADFTLFLSLLARYARRVDVDVHAFTLMTNHVHVMLTPQDEQALGRLMHRLASRYARYFNDTYTRTGTLWEGRYRACLIDSERYWLTCLRYVEQNPVRAGIVATPDTYRWTSYAMHAHGTGPEWLVPHPAYMALGHTSTARQTAYRALCGARLSDDELVLARTGAFAVPGTCQVGARHQPGTE
jgi:putative transposase